MFVPILALILNLGAKIDYIPWIEAPRHIVNLFCTIIIIADVVVCRRIFSVVVF